MKKGLFISLIALITASLAFAQSDDKTEKKAKEILKKVSAKFKSFKSLKATFIITIENQKDKSSDVQKGTIQLKGDKYRLNVAQQDIVSDGKTVWTYMKDANEIQVNSVTKDTNTITPANFLTLYEKGFLFRFTGEEKDKGMVYQLVELVPIDPKKKSVVKVKLKISKKDQMVYSARLIDRSGTVVTYNVEKFSPEAADADSIFTFNAKNYPGAEIIDLR